MACKKTVHVLAILLWALLPVIIPSISYADNIHSDQLPLSKARVIVIFEGDINAATVEKYGQVLKTLKIINGVVAVIICYGQDCRAVLRTARNDVGDWNFTV